MDYRVDVIYVNFIVPVNVSRRNFACLYFESQHLPSDRFSCHMNFIQSRGKQSGMASIDIVHTWSRIHNFLNGKSNQHGEETQFVLKKSMYFFPSSFKASIINSCFTMSTYHCAWA
jgi:hypothetical protein